MSAYKICREGQELGSFNAAQIQEGLQTGYFQSTDWGWCEGMTDWKALPELTGTSTQPLAAASSASKAKVISSPSSIGRTKPQGTPSSSINPYAAPAAKSHEGTAAATGAVPYPVVAELTGTKPWVRLISVLMWIACVLVILAVLGNVMIGVFGASALTKSGNGGAGVGILIGMAVFYGVTAMLVIYPTLKLSNYASNISRLAQTQSFTDLTAALAEQRRFWKFYGILTVIYLSLILLFVVLMIAGIGIGSMAVQRP
jgi:hypothetical protein